MSYSFNFRATTKDEAKQKAQEELDRVVAAQPVHVQDYDAALATVSAYLDLLVDDPGMDIQVSCHGSVSYSWMPDIEPTAVALTQTSLGVSAYLISKEGVGHPNPAG